MSVWTSLANRLTPTLLCSLGFHAWQGCECKRCDSYRHECQLRADDEVVDCDMCHGVGCSILGVLCAKCGATGHVNRPIPGTERNVCAKCAIAMSVDAGIVAGDD